MLQTSPAQSDHGDKCTPTGTSLQSVFKSPTNMQCHDRLRHRHQTFFPLMRTKNKKKIAAVLLTVFTFLILSNFIWCFLLHFYLPSKTPTPPPPPSTLYSITSDLVASQRFWFSKTHEHEMQTLNIGQIFSLWSRLPAFLSRKTVLFSLPLISW